MTGMTIHAGETAVLLRVTAIAVVLATSVVVPTRDLWAGNKSAPDISPHLQRPLDIPLERLDRPQRVLGRLNLNRASSDQLKTLPGLTGPQAEKISQGRPYQHTDELVTRQILSRDAYDRIKDLITVD